MPAPLTLPLEAVAALFLERQHLDRPRGRRLTAASLSAFVEDTGGLQLDSINVVARAHYLTAWNRFGAFPTAQLDDLVWRRRVLVEYWAHAACLVPAAHLGAWRRVMLDYAAGHTGWRSWLRNEARVVRAVERAVRARGPLGNADLRPEGPGRGGAGGWWAWRPAQHAVHYLWMKGRLLVDSRVHFQKRYDLAERVLPELAAVEPLSRAAFLRWHVRQSLHAMGAATELDLRMYLTFPRMARGERSGVLAAMAKSGEVVEVAIAPPQGAAGARAGPVRAWALAEDVPALAAAAGRRAPSRGTALLAPFDSFLWHRERTKRLFGLDYRIEVYTPRHARVHGYYTLPILHDGQLLGRVDAKSHRQEARLEVRRVQLEDWLARGAAPPAARWGPVDRDAALAGVADALQSLAAFTGATRVTLGQVTPPRLGPAVKAALERRGRAALRQGE
ncbi:MAG TPA: crosslink repair DNA glycosylase YcaQ family protein [Myxococcota bacterium]|nr:crosslink repair DNA glycosylase YcaQ family protein [Myxococcota bacterium]